MQKVTLWHRAAEANPMVRGRIIIIMHVESENKTENTTKSKKKESQIAPILAVSNLQAMHYRLFTPTSATGLQPRQPRARRLVPRPTRILPP